MRLGIICAGDTEFFPFLHHLKNERIAERAMLKFHEGTIEGLETVVLYSGVCKVNAAIATQLLIDAFHTDVILNAGTAGGVADDVRLFDTVIADKVAYHDVADDILTDFHPWMKSVYFHPSPELLTLAQAYSKSSAHRIRFGTAVTGEQFIDNPMRSVIRQKYAPLSVDMETAAIAHVCYVNKIPFLSIRSITDTPLYEGIEQFEKNCQRASEISAEITIGLLRELRATPGLTPTCG